MCGYNGRVPIVRSTLAADVERHARRMVSIAASSMEVALPLDARVPRGQPRSGGGPRIIESFYVDRSARRQGTRLVITARNTAPHAKYTDEGTVPHVIVPRSARVLRWDDGGGPVFARRVNHPGNAPGRWFEPVVTDAWDRTLRAAALGL